MITAYRDDICGQLRRLRDFGVEIGHAVLIRGISILEDLSGEDLRSLRSGSLISSHYRYRSFRVVDGVAIFVLGDRL